MQINIRLPEIATEQASGNRLGYSNFAISLRDALEQQGVTYTESSDLALYLGPPHLMPDVNDKLLIANTMWEVHPMPKPIIAALQRADVLVAPSQYCASLFRRNGLHQPIHVVPLGLVSEAYPVSPRVRPRGAPLRFLWVNASDERKGWIYLGQAWSQAMPVGTPATLTIKTSANADGRPSPTIRSGNVRIISQRLSFEDLRDLYCQHQVFVCTSLCEGFGLSPLEAMACGLLVISPRHTGLAEYVHKGVAWVVETERVTMRYADAPDLRGHAQAPKVSHLKALLRRAMLEFDDTYDMRAQAQQHAHQFTWERSAAQLVQVLERYAGRQVA